MERLRILVSGRVAAQPYQGGATWAVLQYVLGLRELGHRVSFVEPLPPSTLQPAGAALAASRNATYFDGIVERYGLADDGAALLLDHGTRETHGCTYDRLLDIAAHTDLLINISGILTDEALLGAIGRRVYLDLDPGFTQLWHAVDGIDMRFDAHTHLATIGQSIGTSACDIPDCGRRWITTPQPVVLSEWPNVRGDAREPLTTVGNWRSYGSVQHDGVLYGQKVHSFRPFYSLPTKTTQPFLLALAIHPDETADLQALDANGWKRCDPALVAATPLDYRQFIHRSMGEFGIAKSGYVQSRCGWFSDRSVCYLASGRPVLAQDTGFESFLPIGHGLFPFESIADVLEGIDAIRTGYDRHAVAARDLAETHFDSAKVLTRLLDHVGACARA